LKQKNKKPQKGKSKGKKNLRNSLSGGTRKGGRNKWCAKKEGYEELEGPLPGPEGEGETGNPHMNRSGEREKRNKTYLNKKITRQKRRKSRKKLQKKDLQVAKT